MLIVETFGAVMKAIDDYEIREKAKFVKTSRMKDFGSDGTLCTMLVRR